MPSFPYQDPVPDEIVCIFFEDTSYPINGDSVEASEALARIISQETGLELEKVDIAPGFSFPAFLAEIDISSLVSGGVVATVLFGGKNLRESLSGWLELAKSLRRLASRKVYLSRTAAASLALEELMKHVQYQPSTEIRCQRYDAYDRRFSWREGQISNETNVRIEYLGFVIHAFEFLVDGRKYLVVVDGKDVAVRYPSNSC